MKSFNIDKEIEFIKGILYLKNKYPDTFMKYYWKPQFYYNGLPDIKTPKTDLDKDILKLHKLLNFPHSHSIEEKSNYRKNIDLIIKKFNFKFNNNISNHEKMIQKASLYRYYVIGALNNISLSVSPKLKKLWNINFELFGAFYNTNYDYCGLFSDIEKSCCDFYTFKLTKNMTILINPPYTKKWIQISCKIINNIMEKKLNTKIYLVIPVWNLCDRKMLNYKMCEDLPEIDDLKKNKYLISHTIKNIEFYNGILKKIVHLKDKVHIFIFTN
jgi:hypothetical protein